MHGHLERLGNSLEYSIVASFTSKIKLQFGETFQYAIFSFIYFFSQQYSSNDSRSIYLGWKIKSINKLFFVFVWRLLFIYLLLSFSLNDKKLNDDYVSCFKK